MNTLPAFGLDIGAQTIKAVWLEKSNSGYKLRSYVNAPAPPHGMASISPVDEDQMVQAISQHVTDAKIGTKQVNISLPDNQVYTKVIETPNLNDKELESSINWIAEQYIPAKLSSIILDWQVLKRDIKSQNGTKMQVLLAGAPQALLQKYKKIIEYAGYSLLGVETEMLSTIRAVASTPSDSASLVLTIGSVSSSIAIVHNGIIAFIYTVPVGGNAINKAIASNFALPLSQADEYKRVYGIKDKAVGGKVRNAIEPILVSLSEEIKKAIAFHRERQQRPVSISQVIISGGTGKMPGIDLYFVNALGLETVTANPFRSLNIANVPKEVMDQGPEFAIAIGLAMNEL